MVRGALFVPAASVKGCPELGEPLAGYRYASIIVFICPGHIMTVLLPECHLIIKFIG